MVLVYGAIDGPKRTRRKKSRAGTAGREFHRLVEDPRRSALYHPRRTVFYFISAFEKSRRGLSDPRDAAVPARHARTDHRRAHRRARGKYRLFAQLRKH